MGTIVVFVVAENKFEFAFECHVEFISYGQWYSISICNLKLNVPVHVLRSHVLDILCYAPDMQRKCTKMIIKIDSVVAKKCGVCLCIILCHLKWFFLKGEMIYVDNKCFKQSLYK